jgi:hypothetical protein
VLDRWTRPWRTCSATTAPNAPTSSPSRKGWERVPGRVDDCAGDGPDEQHRRWLSDLIRDIHRLALTDTIQLASTAPCRAARVSQAQKLHLRSCESHAGAGCRPAGRGVDDIGRSCTRSRRPRKNICDDGAETTAGTTASNGGGRPDTPCVDGAGRRRSHPRAAARPRHSPCHERPRPAAWSGVVLEPARASALVAPRYPICRRVQRRRGGRPRGAGSGRLTLEPSSRRDPAWPAIACQLSRDGRRDRGEHGLAPGRRARAGPARP